MHGFQFGSAALSALPSGALWWPEEALLCVSDLHLGKSGRIARRSGVMLPPYEVTDTLERLEADIRATKPATVVCLGDSFDDDRAALDLTQEAVAWLQRLQAGRRWIWVEGNHDPAGHAPGGTHRREFGLAGLVFRHMAETGLGYEVSGHYHPKATLTGRAGRVTRRCFLYDSNRLVMPAYGTYTGGLGWTDPALQRLFEGGMRAILIGERPLEVAAPTLARPEA